MRACRGAYAHGETCCLDEDRINVGADCPLASMVREICDCIIGDARPEAIPFGRLCVVSDSLRRHAYTVIVEGIMSTGRSSAKPAGLSQLNLNAAGIDVGATSHSVAVPAGRAEQPVQEFGAFTADLYRLADWLAECGVQTVVMESTAVYWIPPLRGARRAGLPGDAGGPKAHQERAGSQDRRGGLPVAPATPHLRPAFRGFPSRRGHTARFRLLLGYGLWRYRKAVL